jgi:prevent-host-death family protein
MSNPGIAELKARLSHFLARVKRGHEVVITERGVPIAKLVPLSAEEGRGSRRERLIREGVIVPGRGRVRASLRKPPKGPPESGAGVLRALLAERDEGR